MRHRWDKESEPGFATCFNCGRRVPAYRVRKGGLPSCPGYWTAPTQKRLDCRYHHYGLIADADICWGCGARYTDVEKIAARHLREAALEELHAFNLKKELDLKPV